MLVLRGRVVSYERGIPVVPQANVNEHLAQVNSYAWKVTLRIIWCAVWIAWCGYLGSIWARFMNNYFAELGNGSEDGSYLKLIDFCITRL